MYGQIAGGWKWSCSDSTKSLYRHHALKMISREGLLVQAYQTARASGKVDRSDVEAAVLMSELGEAMQNAQVRSGQPDMWLCIVREPGLHRVISDSTGFIAPKPRASCQSRRSWTPYRGAQHPSFAAEAPGRWRGCCQFFPRRAAYERRSGKSKSRPHRRSSCFSSFEWVGWSRMGEMGWTANRPSLNATTSYGITSPHC